MLAHFGVGTDICVLECAHEQYPQRDKCNCGPRSDRATMNITFRARVKK